MQRSDELLRCYGAPEGAYYPQRHVSTLFDVLARVPHDAVVGPYGSCERRQLAKLLDSSREGDVLVLDARYPSFDLFVMLLESRLDFVVCVPLGGTLAAVPRFVASGQSEDSRPAAETSRTTSSSQKT